MKLISITGIINTASKWSLAIRDFAGLAAISEELNEDNSEAKKVAYILSFNKCNFRASKGKEGSRVSARLAAVAGHSLTPVCVIDAATVIYIY